MRNGRIKMDVEIRIKSDALCDSCDGKRWGRMEGS
jgi:hypothetical protein